MGDPDYWDQRHYLDLQVDGVYDGYMAANEGKPERVRLFPLSIIGRRSRSGRSSTRTTTATWAIGTRFPTGRRGHRSFRTRLRSTVWTTALR